MLLKARPFPILIAALLFTISSPIGRAAGLVSTCDETHFQDALDGGGLITFSSDCTITVSASNLISFNTTIDGGNHKVTIDGGGTAQFSL